LLAAGATAVCGKMQFDQIQKVIAGLGIIGNAPNIG
jgi:hypothetical protein